MDELTDLLVQSGAIHSLRLAEAFRATDRTGFVPHTLHADAYLDTALPIGAGQTISQPSTVAFMLELLAVGTGERVLDVGAGSGWTSALLAHLVGPSGSVLGLERIPELIAFGTANLARYDRPWAHIEAAGEALGAPEEGPFDRILVSAAARALPGELVAELREGGTLVLPVRHELWRVVRTPREPTIDRYPGFVFVPLIADERGAS